MCMNSFTRLTGVSYSASVTNNYTQVNIKLATILSNVLIFKEEFNNRVPSITES